MCELVKNIIYYIVTVKIWFNDEAIRAAWPIYITGGGKLPGTSLLMACSCWNTGDVGSL